MKNLLRSSLVQNAVALAFTQVAGRLIRLFYIMVIARLLGPADTGIYIYGISLYLGVLSLGMFGQNNFLAQRIGKHGTKLPFIFRHSAALVASATLAISCALSIFLWITEPERDIWLALLCFVGALNARASVYWVRAVYVSLESPTWIPKYETIFRGAEALLGVIALALGGGLLAICFLHFLFWAIEAVFVLCKVRCEHPLALGFAWRRRYMRCVSSISLVVLLSLSAMNLFPQIAVVLLRNLVPDAALVGQFGIAMQFMTTLMIVPVAITQAFLPRLSRAYSRGDGGRDLITALKLVALATLTVAVLASAYGPWFVSLILGSTYLHAAEMFRWLCATLTPYAVVVLLIQALNVINGRGASSWIMGVSVALHAGLLAIFVHYSPELAAIGSMVFASVFGMILAMLQITNRIAIGSHFWWVRTLLVIVGTYVILEGGWSEPMISAPVAIVTGGVLAWLLRVFDVEDIIAIRRLFGGQNFF